MVFSYGAALVTTTTTDQVHYYWSLYKVSFGGNPIGPSTVQRRVRMIVYVGFSPVQLLVNKEQEDQRVLGQTLAITAGLKEDEPQSVTSILTVCVSIVIQGGIGLGLTYILKLKIMA